METTSGSLKASKDLKKLLMEELLGMLKLRRLRKRLVKIYKETCEDTLDEDCFDEDKLSFIFRKIHSMWKKKRGSRWKNNNKKHTKEGKDKTQVVCYEWKNPGYFKFEYPSLEKKNEKEKKKPFI
ncbi:hypothetical protein CR513_42820, partial [Mucuna pruriens]